MPEVKQCWWLKGQRQGALFNYGPQSQTPNAFFGTFPPLSFCLMACLCLLNCPKGQALSCCHLAGSQLGGPDLWRIWFLASCCFIISFLVPVTCCFRPLAPFIQVHVGSPPSHPTASAINGNMAYCSNQTLQWLFVVSSFSQLCLSHLSPQWSLVSRDHRNENGMRKRLNATSVYCPYMGLPFRIYRAATNAHPTSSGQFFHYRF